MSSEQLADGVNPLDAELAATWDVLKGYSGRDTDLGIARRFGGAAAAYSLRDVGAMNGRVIKVRRDVDGQGSDPEEDFSANQVSGGALEDWVNGKLESTLPADVSTAASAYSLRKVKASYSGNAVQVRRTSDSVEVNVAFDSNSKVSSSSSISTVSGSTSATDLNGFLNESVSGFTSVPYSGINPAHKNFTSDPTISDTAFSGTNGGTQSRLVYLNTTDAFITASDFDGCKVKVTGTVNTLSGGDLTVKPSTLSTGGGTWTPSEGNKVISDGTTGAFEYIFTGDGTNGFRSVVFLIEASTTVNVSNLTFEYIEHGATVDTWYDQAGSNNAVQETATNQPKIAENGSLLADGLDFDGSASYLDASSTLGATSTIGIFTVIKPDNTDVDGFIFDGRDANDDGARLMQSDAGIGKYLFSMNTTDVSLPDEGVSTTETLITAIQSSTAATLFRNSAQVATAADDAISVTSGYRIGANQVSTGTYFDGTMKEIILFTSDQSDNRFKIESNINNYYGLYTFQGDGFVETWYDQSGNGFDMAQTTAADQPHIVENGVICKDPSGNNPTVKFVNVGTNLGSTFMTATPISGGQNPFTHLLVASSTNTGASGQTFVGCADGVDLRLSTLAMRMRSGNTNRTTGSNTLTSNTNSLLTYIRASGRVPKMALNNNALEVETATPDAGSDNLNEILGENTTSASNDNTGLVGTISESILYSGDKDADSELSDLKTDINNHYNTF